MSEHQPSPDNFNHDQPATSEPLVCEQCDEPITGSGRRFCSLACFYEWQRERGPRPKPMTFEEMQADMAAVFERLAAYDEEEPS